MHPELQNEKLNSIEESKEVALNDSKTLSDGLSNKNILPSINKKSLELSSGLNNIKDSKNNYPSVFNKETESKKNRNEINQYDIKYKEKLTNINSKQNSKDLKPHEIYFQNEINSLNKSGAEYKKGLSEFKTKIYDEVSDKLNNNNEYDLAIENASNEIQSELDKIKELNGGKLSREEVSSIIKKYIEKNEGFDAFGTVGELLTNLSLDGNLTPEEIKNSTDDIIRNIGNEKSSKGLIEDLYDIDKILEILEENKKKDLDIFTKKILVKIDDVLNGDNFDKDFKDLISELDFYEKTYDDYNIDWEEMPDIIKNSGDKKLDDINKEFFSKNKQYLEKKLSGYKNFYGDIKYMLNNFVKDKNFTDEEQKKLVDMVKDKYNSL